MAETCMGERRLSHLIPDILDERLAIVGGTGSGKSYTARGLVERVLARPHGRAGIIDPTGVWHGLRVSADGKSAGFPVVIFGGDRSDVPLVETAGRVVAQAVASTHQSWIIDTSALKTKAAERRFMLDFLDALFEANRADITLVVDEADRFSPQRMSPEVARLHERMEEIVRRGRVRGFTPWLVTQRPASLNKDVLSQATAMICMRMTGAHDRGAIADVIEGQADKATARQIIGSMPSHKTGHGLVWAPQRGILEAVQFPPIVTLDTMRAPKPGERLAEKPLPPIDIGALREKLATVEQEAAANDPKTLRAEIARLRADLAKKAPAADEQAINAAFLTGQGRGHASGYQSGFRDGVMAAANAANSVPIPVTPEPVAPFLPAPARQALIANSIEEAKRRPEAIYVVSPPSRSPVTVAAGLSRPQQKILDALAWLEVVGIPSADRIRVAMLADASPKSSGFEKNVSTLSTLGYISYPRPGDLRLTEEGRAVSNPPSIPPSSAALHQAIKAKISGPQWALLEVLILQRVPLSRAELAAQAGVSAASSGFEKNVSTLSGFGFVVYPERGYVQAADILFVESNQ